MDSTRQSRHGENQYWDRSESLKVGIEESEYSQLGSDDSEVDIRHVVMNARGKNVAGFFMFSVRRVEVSSWLSARRKWDEYWRMRARQEEECQEFSKVMKYLNERQGKLLAVMDRNRNLTSEAPEEPRKKVFHEIRDLDEKISGEEMELLEKITLHFGDLTTLYDSCCLPSEATSINGCVFHTSSTMHVSHTEFNLCF